MAGLDELYAQGLISDDAMEKLGALLGPEQRPSRLDMLRDALTPSYLRDTPSSPQADRALADQNARPGKIGPPTGAPTMAQMAGGFAGDVGLNALPIGKTLGIFGGVLAKNADHVALGVAKHMADSGRAADDIWKQTGWFKGLDDEWRFEIPDKAARWIGEPGYGKASTTKMQDVLDHPELYANYPHLADMPISRTHPRLGWSGMYTAPDVPPLYGRSGEQVQINRADSTSPRTILLHELQHAVQEHEGFDPGGMPNIDPNDRRYREVFQNYDDPWREIYRRGYGETEARSVEGRQDWSASQRQQQPPWITQRRDVPRSKQIVSKP